MKEPIHHPPKWIMHFISSVSRTHVKDEIEGDLFEFYQYWIAQYGTKRAKWLYLWNALKFLRYASLVSIFPKTQNSTLMINHHMHIAWRSLRTGKGSGFVNVLGLSLGFASSLLIFLWSYKEVNTDRFHADSERLYSVYNHMIFPDGEASGRNTPAKLPAELIEQFPEIEYATGFAKSFRLSLQGVTAETFQKDDLILKMKGSRGSPQFFNIFSYKILEGSPENALLDRSAIAISRKMADIFFGSPAEAIGNTIRYQNKENLNVVLVFEDIGSESSLRFDYLTNWNAWVEADEYKPRWDHFGTQTYIKLKEGVDPGLVEGKLASFLDGYVDFEEGEDGKLRLQPFGEQYLYNNFENGRPAAGRAISVRLFAGIAIFILLIAVINFINLMTAKANERAREVGLRKVIGATGGNLVSQFMIESMMTTIISFLVGLAMAFALLPAMQAISQTRLSFPFQDTSFILSLLIVVLGVGFLAGSYPSWVLSRLGIQATISKRPENKRGAARLRKGLVVFQFSISIFLTVATIALTSQMNYLLDKNLGFQKQDLLYVPIEGALRTNYRTFKEEGMKVPGVVQIDRSSQTPHKMGFSGTFFDWDGKQEDNNTAFTPSSVGYDFVATMGLEITDGRDFDKGRPADANNFLINEKAAEVIGPDALNRTANIFGKEGKIIGIVKDFHFNSLHTPIQPMVLDVKEGLNFGTITIRVASDDVSAALSRLQALYATMNPGYAFEYTFVENIYQEEYRTEQLVSALVPFFAGLAIFISCLGLFGLVTFALQRRIKEVGIRKVLGATFPQLTNLLAKDFAFLMVIALIISLPISYYFLQDWLQGYAYSIDLGWWIFALAAIMCITISGLIIFIKVAKSAISNPVESLRSE